MASKEMDMGTPTLRSTSCPRALAPLLATGFLLLALLMVVSAPANADLVVVPLCAEKHGFAGEFNDHFSIPVEKAPEVGEAIILIARAYPPALGFLLGQWLYLNATYRVSEGVQVSKTSNSYGILELSSVAANTNIDVRVVRVRVDGPVPFRFFSFFANSPACHVAVAPDNSFIAPVPPKLAAEPQPPLTVYFKTVLPPTVNALVVRIASDGRTRQQFRSGNTTYTSGSVLQADSGGTVLLEYTPQPTNETVPYCFTEVSVSYGDWEDSDAARQSSSLTSDSSGSVPLSTWPPTPQPTSVLRRMVWICLYLFLFYQATVSVYNYRVLGKRDLMDIVPCAEFVAAGARMVQLATLRGIGVAHRHKEGYDSLQNIDDPYA
ncbi:hypothetical protein JIQ42_03550 [Leishmania sp. Namibia]|uniref:hypothetical protein n=1 Tax=Leishmania sp. Namibia TaxID=2802991 RepID=UPI001B5FF52A|nr:hypothetical protein JIQ42_03550 [Leishmania sp. Namibia]